MIFARFQHLPIASKVRVAITGACIVVIVATGVALMIAEALIIRNRMIGTVAARANVLSINSAAAVMFHSPQDAEELLRASIAEPGITAATIFDPKGDVFAHFIASPSERAIEAPAAPEYYHRFSPGDLTMWWPMRNPDGRTIGTLGLRMSMSILYRRLGIFAAITLGVVIAASLLALILSHALQRLVTRPILALAETAGHVTRTKDFSVRVQPVSTDEIGQLAAAFDLMLQAAHTSQADLERRVEERTSALQEAYRELEAFSYSVSHDLRSPLRSITGFTEALLEEPGNQLSPESVQHTQRIISAVARMNRLIDGLLDFSRVSKRALHMEHVDLTAMARDVVAELTVDQRNRKLSVTVDRVTPCVGDATLLRQVLVNVIGNAIKYTRERDPAIITFTEEPANGSGEKAYVVRDNGAGFEMKHATRLFQVFERLHEAKRFEGTGIGLATSRRIIERHGGRIWAEAAPEKGAVFYFTLPRHDVNPV